MFTTSRAIAYNTGPHAPSWRATALFSSREWQLVLSLAFSRSCFVPVVSFMFWPQSYFDSDQAIHGLMAKHIAEGRAVSRFHVRPELPARGRSVAGAPFFLVAGASVVALKLPLLVINVVVGSC